MVQYRTGRSGCTIYHLHESIFLQANICKLSFRDRYLYNLIMIRELKICYLVAIVRGSGIRLSDIIPLFLPGKGELIAGSASLKISYFDIS